MRSRRRREENIFVVEFDKLVWEKRMNLGSQNNMIMISGFVYSYGLTIYHAIIYWKAFDSLHHPWQHRLNPLLLRLVINDQCVAQWA